jgi:hypothetical protein
VGGVGAGRGRLASKNNRPLNKATRSRNQRDGEVTSRSHPSHYGIEYPTGHILHFLHTGKREGRDEEEGRGEGKGKIDGRDT